MRIEELDDASVGEEAVTTTTEMTETTRPARLAGDAEADETSRRRRRTTAEMREELRRLRAMRRMVMDEGEDGNGEEAEAMIRAEPKYYESRELEYTNGDAYRGECVDETTWTRTTRVQHGRRVRRRVER